MIFYVFYRSLASMVAWKKQKAVSEHLEWLNFKSRGVGGGWAYRLPLDSLAVSRTNKVLLN